jgi:hypothetical protein
MKVLFFPDVTNEVIDRINNLTNTSPRLWGTMDVAQMLAHCNVTYELVYDDIHPKPNAFVKWMLRMFVKHKVVNETPYKQNGQTAPAFKIKEKKDFEIEKKRLIDYLRKTQNLGSHHFKDKESHSFGVLTDEEWNNMFYKHLDHHLKQFGV